MLTFIAATYNEENEIRDLIHHVDPFVDEIKIADDGSTDKTVDILKEHKRVEFKVIPHTGLPETVKNEALKMVRDGSWVLMLDADERLSFPAIEQIKGFMQEEEKNWDYVYFNQLEIIDGRHERTFQKCKLFRKEAVRFPLENIHADDQFEGRGTYFGWTVYHRKTVNKQILREKEYLDTYKRLLSEGKIDEGRYNWLIGLHHYEK